MSELEDILGKASTLSDLAVRAQTLNPETLKTYPEILKTWYRQLDGINNALPERNLGEKILNAINAYISQLSKEDAVQIIEFSHLRLKRHTDKGGYKKNYQGIDDDIDELPKIMCDLKRSAEDPTLPSLFLEYCRRESPDTSIKHLPDCFERFAKVKKWYESVPEEFKILPIMRDDPKLGAGKWDNLRKLLKPDDPKDQEYANWIQKFEDLENEYKFSFTNVIDFITKCKSRRNNDSL
ncbi:MAG: hypothetical protein QXT19_02675 [Candidatus Woesearchaeota archaeon]